jgi:hypothetical protein
MVHKSKHSDDDRQCEREQLGRARTALESTMTRILNAEFELRSLRQREADLRDDVQCLAMQLQLAAKRHP